MPTSPRYDPSTEASTGVRRDGRPSNTRASSSRAAVSGAARSVGNRRASRAAMITI